MKKKKVTIFGSTGSVGQSTLSVLDSHKNLFEIVGLTINSNYKELIKQVNKYKPKVVCIVDNDAYIKFKNENNSPDVIILCGENCLVDVLEFQTDFVMAAIVGSAGLLPVIEAAKLGLDIGLANKESLVCAGNILKLIIKKYNSKILPIDSEHNAIFQVFENSNKGEINKIILTASGGPFLNKKENDLINITPEQAILHPNWEMGKKISVDSATLMNKGLEFIEAHYLFDMTIEKIDVLIHPQSIIHSCVSYSDGSILAQMGTPDMRTPIAFALGYPDRISAPTESLNLAQINNLSFSKPDNVTFPALNLAINSLKTGGSAPTVLNAANEIAVGSFLDKKISFLSISKIVDLTLNKSSICELNTIEDVMEIDKQARIDANEFIQKEK